MLASKLAYRVSLLAAVLIVILSVYGQIHSDLTPCGKLAANYPTILAFEAARSGADLQAIFGDGSSACQKRLGIAPNALNTADNFLFIPAYAAFLIFFFLGARARDSKLAVVGLSISAGAALADYAENVCLFQLVASPDAPSAWLLYLPWATGAKWIGLAIAGVIGGAILAKRGGFGYPAALACALGFAIVALAIYDPHSYGAQISNGVLLSWIVFLIVDARESFRRA
ncbi:MAG: hypothetical protein HY243_16080 [Proteobacteria bacterium]|nr:hypothetical protein [Pseudomonadota bacterium]